MVENPLDAIATAVALAAVGVIGAILFAWSGLYNVAASRGHWVVMDRFLRFGMENSVRLRAPEVLPPSLDDPDRIRLGAAHYHGGCAFCHGAPGTRPSPVVQQMLPAPPDLQLHAGLWSDQELFWIVKHGLKYAGMPAWPAQDRDDEVWSVVAFLKRLPLLEAAAYEDLALGPVEIRRQQGGELATAESDPDGVGACARCHGASASGPSSSLVPSLSAQPREWLARSLSDYAEGARHSGIMQPLAAGLSPRAMTALAEYYSGLPPVGAPPTAPAGSVDAGRRLATEGDPAALVPPCLACHGVGASPNYPRLAGQSARYISAQLHAWRNGKLGKSATHAIMAPIARRLSETQITDAAAYFSALPPSTGEAENR